MDGARGASATSTSTATGTGTINYSNHRYKSSCAVNDSLDIADESISQQQQQSSTANKNRPIYVSATKQHVGKTTTSLALISGLKKRFPNTIGFIKPVGQQQIPVYSEADGETIHVDKDVALMKEHFKLNHCDYRDMSPVLIPSGYTKDYIDGKISNRDQLNAIQNAMEHVASRNEVVLCEGTGHCAVGSIVGASNAKVASVIGASMVLVANGGLGEIHAMCDTM